MLRRRGHGILFAALVAALAVVASAEDKLAVAYSAILRGDYPAGRNAVSQLRESGAPPEQVAQVENWLKSWEEMNAGRADLRARTLAWHVEHAKQAMAEAEKAADPAQTPDIAVDKRDFEIARRTYLALSFAQQASLYAEDEAAFGREPWMQTLRMRAMERANHLVESQKWSKAHAFYVQLERIFSKDTEIKELREKVARHARIEVLYGESKEVDRRLEGVKSDMLDQSVRIIADYYFKKPDFKAMAEGAIDNLVGLTQTTKLYDASKDASKHFTGIAMAEDRNMFLRKLDERRREVAARSEFDHNDLLRLFKNIKNDNSASVKLPESLLVVEFTEGALGKLDQFTSMIWPADAVDFDKQMMGNFFGVGIQLGVDEATNRLKAVTALENSPALRAGIQPDDLIIRVNGEDTAKWTTDKAVRNITGEKGTTVVLTIQRPATGQELEFKLERSEIKLKTVRGVNRLDDSGERWNYMLDPAAGIGYVRLTGFNPESGEELHRALRDAKQQGMKGLILDLRYNPGGLLDVAIETVSEFVRKGDVVTTRGRSPDERQQHRVAGRTDFPDLPLVVLVNEASASASEILAGALQDHNRAAVLGERTFGKGSVQKVMGLGSWLRNSNKPGARLKLTTALYYLPNGRTPHKQTDAEVWGVDPNWEIRLTPKEISKVIERERKAYIIHNETKADPAAAPTATKVDISAAKNDAATDEDRDDEDLLTKEDIELLRSDPHKAPDVDPQLETALLQLRTKLAGDMPWPRQLAQNAKADD